MKMLDVRIQLSEVSLVDPMQRIAVLQAELVGLVQSIARDDEQVSPSAISGLPRNTCEAGVYLRRGGSIGALVNIAWNVHRPEQARITVRALSKAQVTLVWILLGVGMALGFGATALLGPYDDGRVGFLLGLVFGLLLALALVFGALKLNIGGRSDSVDVGERLADAVEAWSEPCRA